MVLVVLVVSGDGWGEGRCDGQVRGSVWGCAAGTGLSCFADYLLGAHRCELAQVELGCAHTLLVRHEGRAVATRVEAHLVKVRVRVRVKARVRVRVRARVRGQG